MAKPRLCPSCSTLIPINRGFTFDESLNMRCLKCGEIVVPSKADAQAELDSVLKKNVKAHSSLNVVNGDNYHGRQPAWTDDPGDY